MTCFEINFFFIFCGVIIIYCMYIILYLANLMFDSIA